MDRLITWGVLAIFIGTIAAYFWMRRTAPLALQRIYFDVQLMKAESRQEVEFRFHTYWGFLVFFVQQEHRLRMPADVAEVMLRRLHQFNLRWGMFAAGCAFIPFISWLNYKKQLSMIQRASSGGFEVVQEKAL